MARGGKRPGAGRPVGSKEKHTLEREARMERVRQRVFEATDNLIDSQMLLAKGMTYVCRVTIGARGGRSDPELVTNEDDSAAYQAEIAQPASPAEQRGALAARRQRLTQNGAR